MGVSLGAQRNPVREVSVPMALVAALVTTNPLAPTMDVVRAIVHRPPTSTARCQTAIFRVFALSIRSLPLAVTG